MISIVIPARNEEKLLPDCLGSLRNQDYPGDYEIIVVDNGSTDATADIARSFGAKVIAANAEGSVFYARQAGADAARGDIIIYYAVMKTSPSDFACGVTAGRWAWRPIERLSMLPLPPQTPQKRSCGFLGL